MVQALVSALSKESFGNNQSRRSRRFLHDKHAISLVISSVILTATVLTMGFVILYWAQYQATSFNIDYASRVNDSLDLVNEEIIFVYRSYNQSENELVVYLMNIGSSSDVKIRYFSLQKGSWRQLFYDIQLTDLNGTQIEDLDSKGEAFFKVNVSLPAYSEYQMHLVTDRGAAFEASIAT